MAADCRGTRPDPGLQRIGCPWQQRADHARADILARIPALAPPVETVLPLTAAARGHELVESRRPLGKVILRPDAAA